MYPTTLWTVPVKKEFHDIRNTHDDNGSLVRLTYWPIVD